MSHFTRSTRAHRLVRGSALTALSAAALVGALLPTPAAAATAQASVTSSPTVGVRLMGSDLRDQVVLTRAGTSTAPLIVVDTAAPLTVGTGCQPVTGDPTRAVCTAPLVGTSLKPVLVFSGAGDDSIAHGASLPIPMTVNTGTGNDTVTGGPAVDTLTGSSGSDVLRGGDGTDTLRGSSGDDTLDGGPGRDDNLFGQSGNDRLLGGDGDSDDLDGGSGADTFDGGAGRNDIVLYNTRTNAVTVNLGSTATAGETGEGDRILSGVENVMTGSGADLLFGDDGDNSLLSGAGNDLILGGRGQDAVVGGEGDDILSGNTISLVQNEVNSDGVRDFIAGQGGNDSCIVSPADSDLASGCESTSNDD